MKNMNNTVKTIAIIAMCAALASCAGNNTGAAETSASGTSAQTTAAQSSTTSQNTVSDVSGAIDSTEQTTAAEVSAKTSVTVSTAEASDMFSNRDYEIGYSDCTEISFSADGASVSGDGATAQGSVVTITAAGSYRITGTVGNGQIVVDAGDEKVQIVLDNASVTCTGSAALYVKSADKVFVTSAEGSTNALASTGEFVQTDDNKVDGAVFAKSDITFNGSGTLNISSDSKHGIVCKDDVKITSGTYSITAAAKGIDCNESVRIAGGNVTITSGTDGIHAENSDDTAKGFVFICGGTLKITSGTDAIDASGEVTCTGGILDLTSDGGAANAPAHTNDFGGGYRWDRDSSTNEDGSTSESAKGIKSDALITITGGTISIDSSDDGIHSDTSVSIGGGDITISSGDDGIHAEDTTLISDGTVTITQSYEGIEGEVIEISGGKVSVRASDDGMNAAGGETTSGFGMMDTDANAKLIISGGEIYVNADGDGLDSNGYLYVTGGRTFVSGPTNAGNGALDYGIEGTITGGYLVAAGSTGMAENFGSASTQCSILYTFDSALSGGTTITLSDSSGNEILSFTPEKNYQCAVISAPEITTGSTYTITADGKSYTVEMTSTIYGSGSGFGNFGGGGFGGNNGNGGFGGGKPGRGTNTGTGSGSGTASDSEPPQAPSGTMPEMSGEAPQMPENGEMPDFNGGEMPQMPENGEMPQMPGNGEMPDFSGGNMPQKPGGRGGQQNSSAVSENDTSPT